MTSIANQISTDIERDGYSISRDLFSESILDTLSIYAASVWVKVNIRARVLVRALSIKFWNISEVIKYGGSIGKRAPLLKRYFYNLTGLKMTLIKASTSAFLNLSAI